MARKKKRAKKTTLKKYGGHDISQWNFVIFLTLAFILLVVVVNAVNGVAFDLRSRAGNRCPQLTLPRAEDCQGGWTFKRASDGCVAFFCEATEAE